MALDSVKFNNSHIQSTFATQATTPIQEAIQSSAASKAEESSQPEEGVTLSERSQAISSASFANGSSAASSSKKDKMSSSDWISLITQQATDLMSSAHLFPREERANIRKEAREMIKNAPRTALKLEAISDVFDNSDYDENDGLSSAAINKSSALRLASYRVDGKMSDKMEDLSDELRTEWPQWQLQATMAGVSPSEQLRGLDLYIMGNLMDGESGEAMAKMGKSIMTSPLGAWGGMLGGGDSLGSALLGGSLLRELLK